MNKHADLIKNKLRWGWFFVILGIIFIGVGIVMETTFGYLPYSMSIITGLGILWAGIGIGMIVRYRSALRGNQSTKRLFIEEHDERNQFIRFRAGYRGFWVSILMVYILLLWLSFAANCNLPPIGKDLLWYIQAACVVIPFIVYVVSTLSDQKKL